MARGNKCPFTGAPCMTTDCKAYITYDITSPENPQEVIHANKCLLMEKA